MPQGLLDTGPSPRPPPPALEDFPAALVFGAGCSAGDDLLHYILYPTFKALPLILP